MEHLIQPIPGPQCCRMQSRWLCSAGKKMSALSRAHVTFTHTIFHAQLCHTHTHELTYIHTYVRTYMHTIFSHTFTHSLSPPPLSFLPSPSPLQPLKLSIGRSWLVGLSDPLIFPLLDASGARALVAEQKPQSATRQRCDAMSSCPNGANQHFTNSEFCPLFAWMSDFGDPLCPFILWFVYFVIRPTVFHLTSFSESCESELLKMNFSHRWSILPWTTVHIAPWSWRKIISTNPLFSFRHVPRTLFDFSIRLHPLFS